MLRATISCTDGDSLAEALQYVVSTFDVRVGNGRFKNLLGTTRHMPPRIIVNCVVCAPGCRSIMAEIQIHLASIKKIAEWQHRYYVVRRASELSELIAEANAEAIKEPKPP